MRRAHAEKGALRLTGVASGISFKKNLQSTAPNQKWSHSLSIEQQQNSWIASSFGIQSQNSLISSPEVPKASLNSRKSALVLPPTIPITEGPNQMISAHKPPSQDYHPLSQSAVEYSKNLQCTELGIKEDKRRRMAVLVSKNFQYNYIYLHMLLLCLPPDGTETKSYLSFFQRVLWIDST